MNTLSQLNHQLAVLLESPNLVCSSPPLELAESADLTGHDSAQFNNPTSLEDFAMIARAILSCLSVADLKSAYDHALKLRDMTVTDDPFEGKAFSLAARLARAQGDDEGETYFETCAERAVTEKAALLALGALGSAIASPYLVDVSASGSVQIYKADAPAPLPVPWLLPPTTTTLFSPLSNTRLEPPTRTYIVLVRKLTDPVTASFTVVSALLADLTDGGPLGREDRHGDRYADLLLEFGSEALSLLGSLDLDALSMRFVFKTSREFETFSVSDNTLFGLEAAIEESRLYFKLKVPAAWLAAELPLHLIWANVESCVLLSVAD